MTAGPFATLLSSRMYYWLSNCEHLASLEAAKHCTWRNSLRLSSPLKRKPIQKGLLLFTLYFPGLATMATDSKTIVVPPKRANTDYPVGSMILNTK